MGDIPNVEKNRIVVEGPTGHDLVVNADGSINIVSAGVDLSVAEQSFLTSYEGTVGTSETDVLLIKNPTAGTKNVFLDAIILTAVTAGRTFWVRGYENPTITANGTTVLTHGVVKRSTEPSASLLAYSAPTISARGDRNFVVTSGQFQLSIPLEFRPMVVLYPNYNFLFTILASGNTSAFAIDLRWREIPQ